MFGIVVATEPALADMGWGNRILAAIFAAIGAFCALGHRPPKPGDYKEMGFRLGTGLTTGFAATGMAIYFTGVPLGTESVICFGYGVGILAYALVGKVLDLSEAFQVPDKIKVPFISRIMGKTHPNGTDVRQAKEEKP